VAQADSASSSNSAASGFHGTTIGTGRRTAEAMLDGLVAKMKRGFDSTWGGKRKLALTL
jgi:hypothetical protein